MYTLMRGFVPRARPASAGEINNLPDFCGFYQFCACGERRGGALGGEGESGGCGARQERAHAARAARSAVHTMRGFSRAKIILSLSRLHSIVCV